MTDPIVPEAKPGEGKEEVVISKQDHDAMVEALAKKAEAEARLVDEVTELRKKNRDLVTKGSQVPAEDVSKLIEAEFKKRETQDLEKAKESALADFLDAHPEFSKESDEGGLLFAAYQKALARISLSGVKTKDDYTQVLEDAMRLTVPVNHSMPVFSSTPRSASEVRSVPKNSQLTTNEQKLVQNNFGGDVERYMAIKAKRPEYVEELLKYVR